MRVPAHAAVAATVDLARAVLGRRPRPAFVNAVLRRVAARDADAVDRRGRPDRSADPVGASGRRPAPTPGGSSMRLRDALGGDRGTRPSGSWSADNAPPAGDPGRPAGPRDVDELVAAGRAARAAGRRTRRGGPATAGGPARGPRGPGRGPGRGLASWWRSPWPARRWTGPDAPLARPVRRAGRQGRRCSTRSAAQRGARLVAVERQEHRAGAGARRGPGRASGEVVVADGRSGPWRAGAFDRVLVDVALHRPGGAAAPTRRRGGAADPADLAALAPLQRELLGAALDAVRPGGAGRLRHLLPAPGRDAGGGLRRAAAARGDVEPVDARPAAARACPTSAPGPHVQLWPHVHGTTRCSSRCCGAPERRLRP